MKKKIIPIFIPHQGCPHDCIFCNQKKITGIETSVTPYDVKNIIDEYLTTIDKDCSIEIAFFGGSFTAIEINTQKSLLSVAKTYVEKGIVSDIRLSTRPDCIDDEILTMLKQHNVTIIELGVQSLDEEVLKESIRGHEAKEVYTSARLIKSYGIKLGLQMMIGLPTDTYEKCIYTAKEFVKMKPDFVRVYPTLVVKETGLENLLNKNLYKPFTLDESINIVKNILALFYKNNINVIRVGLQSSEDIQIGKAILSGPYHPAYRELVESRMIIDYIEDLVIKNNIKDSVIVETNKKNISKIIGNKKSNLNYMKSKYNINLKTLEKNLDIDKLNIILDDTVVRTTIKEIYDYLYEIYDI